MHNHESSLVNVENGLILHFCLVFLRCSSRNQGYVLVGVCEDVGVKILLALYAHIRLHSFLGPSKQNWAYLFWMSRKAETPHILDVNIFCL